MPDLIEQLENAERDTEFLRELLRNEWHLNRKMTAPWTCVQKDCPRNGKPMDKGCRCFSERLRVHVRSVIDEVEGR